MILVVGDWMIDEYVHGITVRISPEAPVPVLSSIQRDWCSGGAGNVAENVRTLGGDCTLIGVRGYSMPNGMLWEHPATYLFKDPDRPTTVKTRVIANGQQLVRMDTEDCRPITGDIEADIVRLLELAVPDADAIVVSDYGKGVVTKAVARAVLDNANSPVIVDSKRADWEIFNGATLATPNRAEYVRCKDSVHLHAHSVLVTSGDKGMDLHSAGVVQTIPALPVDVVDVVGAGDTVVAALAIALGNNGETSLLGACEYAARVASFAVSKPGTACVTWQELCDNDA